MNSNKPALHISGWLSGVAGLMLLMTAPVCAQPQPVLEGGGLGKVRIGMAVRQAERTLGVGLRSLIPGYGEGCWLAVRADGIDPGLSYMVEHGWITRIDVAPPQEGERRRFRRRRVSASDQAGPMSSQTTAAPVFPCWRLTPTTTTTAGSLWRRHLRWASSSRCPAARSSPFGPDAGSRSPTPRLVHRNAIVADR